MAPPLRVKEKSAWKTVKIPEDLLHSEEFDGLVDIQELTEYDLVPFDAAVEENELSQSKRSRKRKRKQEAVQEIETSETQENADDNDDGSPPKRKRKRKGKKSEAENKKNTVTENERTVHSNKSEPAENAKDDGKVTKKKKKKGKGNLENPNLTQTRTKTAAGIFVKSENVLLVEEDDAVSTSASVNKRSHNGADNTNTAISAGKPTDASKKKKKRKKKKAPVENQGSDSSTKLPNTNTQTEDGSASGKKKKRKRNRKKCKSQNGTPTPDTDSSDREKHNTVDAEESMESDGDEDVAEPETKRPKLDMSQWKNLFVPDIILKGLQDQGFDSPTTIQLLALPSAIRDRKDILGAAETGSGKTLAFGIPLLARIINSERFSKVQKAKENLGDTGSDEESDGDDTENSKIQDHPPQALILEPTRELAVQVKKHLTALAKHTDIKFAIVVGGMSIEKQRRILGKKPQVVIATPGRLWQLFEEGNDHVSQIDKVQCLVVDEADRMIEKGHYEELTKILEMMNKSSRRVKNRQTFVMSATLTMEVSAPKRLLNKKKKPKEEDKLKTLTERICVGQKPKVIDLTPKDKVAQTLTELRVNCKADEKDMYLYYFLCQHPGRTLVFANSKDCLRRLVSVFTLLQCSPLPLHADMHQRQRLKNLDKFSENSRSLLVASDVAARGLDIPNVDHVIHYQVPRTMENYVHRSGRTARASNLGLSVMFVGPEDVRGYRKIVSGVRNGEELPLLPVEMELLPAVKLRVGLAKDIDVKEHRIKKKQVRNNFFTRAAEEMDMIVDDRNLLEDVGDSADQAQDRHQLKQMKAQLATMLRGQLQPLRMTKYPTKSGQLVSKQVVSLHKTR